MICAVNQRISNVWRIAEAAWLRSNPGYQMSGKRPFDTHIVILKQPLPNQVFTPDSEVAKFPIMLFYKAQSYPSDLSVLGLPEHLDEQPHLLPWLLSYPLSPLLLKVILEFQDPHSAF